MKMALQYQRAAGHPARTRFLTVRGGYHGDTFDAMSVCDPVTGMHHLFADVLPQQLFAPAPAPRFGAPCTDADIADFRTLIEEHADRLAAVTPAEVQRVAEKYLQRRQRVVGIYRPQDEEPN